MNSMCKIFFSFEKVLQHPHAITIFEDFVYWTDRYINRVMRAHKWHGENQTVMLFNLPQPMGLVAVHPARQPAGIVEDSEHKSGFVDLNSFSSFIYNQYAVGALFS